jgi:choline kinase
MKAVIIAAGASSRLTERTDGLPKSLLPLGSGTILSAILSNLSLGGIGDFNIVVGCQSESIIGYLADRDYFGLRITFVHNDEWKRGNGISVLSAAELVKNEEFILSMSDHIVPSSAVTRIVNSEFSENLLLVDKNISDVFDIDDATKVRLDGRKIMRIGKNIEDYNGIDCGIFRLNSRFFDSMRGQLKAGMESISAGIEGLIKNDDMAAVFLETPEEWIDIDTPDAYHHALKIFQTEPSSFMRT